MVAIDFSTEMLRIASLNYPFIEFRHGDVESLSFGDETFDAVVMNYLLLHLEDPDRAILEVGRILKPRGRLVFTVWLPPDRSPGLALMLEPVRQFADQSVVPPAKDVFLYSRREYVLDSLLAKGFDHLDFREIDTYWDVDSGDAFFQAVQAGSRMGGMIDLQSREIKEKIRDNIIREIDRYALGGRYVVPTPSLLVSAVKA